MENLGKMEILSIEDLYKGRGPDKKKRRLRDSRWATKEWKSEGPPIRTDWKSWTPGTKEYEESRKVEKGQVKGYTRTRKGKMERVSPYAKQFALKEKRVNRAIAKLDKVPEKIKTIGSQKRESLATTDFELVSKKGKEIILRDKETGIHELWSRNDNFAGYTIDVGGKGYEFVREVKDIDKLESLGVKIDTEKVGEPFSTDKKGRGEKGDFDLLTEDEKDVYMMMRDEGWSHDKAMRKMEEEGAPDYEDLLYQEAKERESDRRADSYGEPFSATTKQMEHEVHRMSTMSDKALITRANKITNTDKLIRFYAVAEKLNRPELMSHIKNTGKDKFGLKDSDFEPLSDWEKKKSPTLQKAEVKPFTRTRKWKLEHVKGHHRDVPFANRDIRAVIKEGRIADVAYKPSDLPKRGKGEVVPIRGGKLIEDIKAGTSPYQKMSMAENYIIDLGGYGPRGEPYSTKGVQIQKIGGVDVKRIIQSAYPSYKGRKVSIGTNIPSQLNSWWDEGNRSYYTFYELATGRMQAAGSNHPMFEAKQPRYLSSLPSGVVIVAHNYFGSKQSIHIYANESDLTSTSHPAGGLDQAIKNFTSNPAGDAGSSLTGPLTAHEKNIYGVEPDKIGSPFSTSDKTEGVRRQLVGELNSSVASDDPSQERKRLEAQYGKVWDTSEMTLEFETVGFMAPFVVVKRRSDGSKGSMMFQHNPRFYFNFTKEPGIGEPFSVAPRAATLDLDDDSISQEKLGEHINALIERAGKKRMIRPSTPKEHQIKIAEDTLKMPGAMAGVMGGPTKEEAKEVLKDYYSTSVGSTFSMKTPSGPRAVHTIAQEITKDWKNVNFGAVPYLNAMHALETIDTPYGADSGSSVIAYFLANAQTWKGETAKRVKKELNAMLKTSYKKSMEDEVLDNLVKAESRVKSHWRSIKGKLVNVREHQRYKLKGMLNHVRYSKEAGESRGATLRSLQDKFGLSTEMAHRVHRLADALGSSLFKPFPMK